MLEAMRNNTYEGDYDRKDSAEMPRGSADGVGYMRKSFRKRHKSESADRFLSGAVSMEWGPQVMWGAEESGGKQLNVTGAVCDR